MNPSRFESVTRAIERLRRGEMIIVTDDADREHEADFVLPALGMRPADVATMAREGRGLICCAIDAATADRLRLEPYLDHRSTALHGTAFTESVDWRHGTSTGISAADRAATLRALADPASRPQDFARPGHLFPIVARKGGVLERGGHTEAAVDLCRLAGFPPAAAICEIVNDDGTMARENDVASLSARLGAHVVSVAALLAYRRMTEELVAPAATAALPTRWGDFTLSRFDSPFGPSPRGPLLLARGLVPLAQGATAGGFGLEKAIAEAAPPPAHLYGEDSRVPLLLRIQAECPAGELFDSLRYHCRGQLEAAMRLIGSTPEGAIIYLREERQLLGLEPDPEDGLSPDPRSSWEAAQILKAIGRTRVSLVTDDPTTVAALEEWGIEVAERIPLLASPSPDTEPLPPAEPERPIRSI